MYLDKLFYNKTIFSKLIAIQVIHEICFKCEYKIPNFIIKENYDYHKANLYNNPVL